MRKGKYESAFIIRTPYHYINALEAAERYEVDEEKSILFIWSNHFKERFEHILTDRKWGRIEYLPVVHHDKDAGWAKKIKNVWEDIDYLIQANLILWRVGKVNKCFSIIPLEKYVQHIINKIEAEKLIIIDEGVGSFYLTDKYLSRRKQKTERKIYKYDRRRNKNYEFFTSYPLTKHIKSIEKEEVKKHSFDLLKSKIDFDGEKCEGGIILGTERNERTDKIYHEFISESIKFMEKRVKKIWYKPHRMESKISVKKMLEKTGVGLIKNDLPIEIALLEKGITPRLLSGFSSTAIHSIRKIYGEKVEKVKVFGLKGDCGENNMAYEYYESLPSDQVDVNYL